MFLSLSTAFDPGHLELFAGLSLLAYQGTDIAASENILTDLTVQKVLRAVFSILIAYGTLSILQSLANWASERVPLRFRLLIKQSTPFWKGLILIITVSYLINLFLKISESNLIALTGTIAVALGFAFKDYVSSIIAGVVTLFEAPYRVGDRIKIGDDYGEIVSYGLRDIRLQTPNDDIVTIPHNKVWTDSVSNANSGELEAQVTTDFYFGHGIDIEQVMQILYQAAYSSRYTQLKQPVVVILSERPWGIHFRLKSYPIDARDEFAYQTDLTCRSRQAFTNQELPTLNMPSYFSMNQDQSGQ